MWDFFRFKDNEKYKNKNNSRKGDEEKADDDHHNSFELSNEKPKKHFFVADFPEKITLINNAYPYLKEKEEIILHKIIDH